MCYVVSTPFFYASRRKPNTQKVFYDTRIVVNNEVKKADDGVAAAGRELYYVP